MTFKEFHDYRKKHRILVTGYINRKLDGQKLRGKIKRYFNRMTFQFEPWPSILATSIIFWSKIHIFFNLRFKRSAWLLRSFWYQNYGRRWMSKSPLASGTVHYRVTVNSKDHSLEFLWRVHFRSLFQILNSLGRTDRSEDFWTKTLNQKK